jgi:hypothetical protein
MPRDNQARAVERDAIQQSLSSHQELIVGDSWYVISAKW